MTQTMKSAMQAHAPARARQGGVALLEALIGILIFSIGILAVVGMQATAIRTVTDSKYRSEAAFLASQLMTQMWTDAGNIAQYSFNGTGVPPARLTAWVAQVDARLPGTTTVKPVVTVTGASASGGVVQIQVFWQLPEEASQGLPARNYILLASVFTS
jgi:type IV pilus assembly protein PilV